MKYLIQRRKGQRDHIYEYTETLAAKVDMFPIDEESAKEILREQRDKGQKIIEAKPEKNTVVQPQAAEKRRVDMKDIVTPDNAEDDVQPLDEIDDVTEYNPDKDPIIKKVFSLKTKNAVEGFALEQGIKVKRNKTTRMIDMQREFATEHITKMTALLQED